MVLDAAFENCPFSLLSLLRHRVGSGSWRSRSRRKEQKKTKSKFSTHIRFIEFCMWRTTAEFWFPMYLNLPLIWTSFVLYINTVWRENWRWGGNELMLGHVCALQQMYFNSYGRPGTLNFFSFFKYFIF